MNFRISATHLATSAILALAAAAPAHATSLLGSVMFGGNPTNYYDPANGYVPPGYGNSGGQPVAVGPGVEFGFLDGANQDTADFTQTSLDIQDITFTNAASWTQIFTASTPGFFSGISLVGDTFPGGVSYSVAGDTLTVTWGGTSSPGTANADFTFAGGSVPEPATWAVMLAGLGLTGCVLRNRRRSSLATA